MCLQIVGYGLCTGISFWISRIVIKFPGIVWKFLDLFWYFLDVPGTGYFLQLYWKFPGVVLDDSWSCTVCFLELYWMSDEWKCSWTGVKLD